MLSSPLYANDEASSKPAAEQVRAPRPDARGAGPRRTHVPLICRSCFSVVPGLTARRLPVPCAAVLPVVQDGFRHLGICGPSDDLER